MYSREDLRCWAACEAAYDQIGDVRSNIITFKGVVYQLKADNGSVRVMELSSGKLVGHAFSKMELLDLIDR